MLLSITIVIALAIDRIGVGNHNSVDGTINSVKKLRNGSAVTPVDVPVHLKVTEYADPKDVKHRHNESFP